MTFFIFGGIIPLNNLNKLNLTGHSSFMKQLLSTSECSTETLQLMMIYSKAPKGLSSRDQWVKETTGSREQDDSPCHKEMKVVQIKHITMKNMTLIICLFWL